MLKKQRDELLVELKATESRLHEVATFCATIEQQRDELLRALKQAHRFLHKNGYDMTDIDATIAKAEGAV